MNLLPHIYIVVILSTTHLPALTQADEEPFRLNDMIIGCSNRLAKLIHDFCSNMHKIVKRDTSVIIDKLIPEELQEHMQRERRKRWLRVRRQVASECCNRPCTVGNILLYCPVDATVLKEHSEIFE